MLSLGLSIPLFSERNLTSNLSQYLVVLRLLLLGLILFHLLMNNLVAETEKEIFKAVLEGNLDLESQPWPSISDGAKDLIRKMLARDRKKRMTAAQALGKDICI